jgi:hypothetical protein
MPICIAPIPVPLLAVVVVVDAPVVALEVVADVAALVPSEPGNRLP